MLPCRSSSYSLIEAPHRQALVEKSKQENHLQLDLHEIGPDDAMDLAKDFKGEKATIICNDLSICIAMLESNPSLTALNIETKDNTNGCGNYRSELDNFKSALAKHPALRVLTIDDKNFFGNRVRMFVDALEGNSTLHKLSLTCTGLSEYPEQKIAELLDHSKTLEVLKLNFPVGPENGIGVLIKALETNMTLKELALIGDVTNEDIKALAHVLKANSVLTTLSLDCKYMKSEGLTDFATALNKNKSLVCLNLINQPEKPVDDQAIKAFVNAAKAHPALMAVTLDGWEIYIDHAIEFINKKTLSSFNVSFLKTAYTFPNVDETHSLINSLTENWVLRSGDLGAYRAIENLALNACIQRNQYFAHYRTFCLMKATHQVGVQDGLGIPKDIFVLIASCLISLYYPDLKQMTASNRANWGAMFTYAVHRKSTYTITC